MNLVVAVEGWTEYHMYRKWIPYLNPSLTPVDSPSKIQQDHFAVVSGGGYPHYFDVAKSAYLYACDSGNIDRFVIAVDSEDMTLEEKQDEIENRLLAPLPLGPPVYVIIQHFCLKAWFLGNRRMIPLTPVSEELRKLKSHYDVRKNDPELLTTIKEGQNRATLAKHYLKTALRERNPKITYRKSLPDIVLKKSYLEQCQQRFYRTNHILSFGSFLGAFSP